MELVLYYSPGACSLAAHIALREAGLPFELQRIVLAEKEHLKPEYLAINPRARVPTLLVDARPVRELSAILVWLGEFAPQLFPPPRTPESAKCLEWLAYFTSSIHITFAQIWRGERFLRERAFHKLLRWEALDTLRRQFADIEEQLASGPYLVGSAFTIADVNAIVFYRWGRRVGLDMESDFPRWTKHTKHILQRRSVIDALAEEGIEFWAPRDEASMEPIFTREALAEFDAAWESRDVETLLAHMRPEGVYAASVGPEPGETFVGPALRAGFIKMLAFDSARTRRSGRSWHLGDVAFAEWFFDEPLDTGETRTIRGIDVFELAGGKIMRKDAYRKCER